MPTWISISLALLVAFMSGHDALAQEASPVASTAEQTSLRGTRYCEVLVPARETVGTALMLRVYNTQGLNDCPEAEWSALDAQAEAERLGVPTVLKNGPRFVAFDRISAEFDGSVETFQGLAMQLIATLELPSGVMPQDQAPYSEMVVHRTTEYVYIAGQPVFELISPDGRSYIMQTYVAEINPSGEMSGLASLGSQLTLPERWTFRVVVLEQDLHVATIDGQATVVRDNLENIYQLLPED
jgi:hypothetical protein